MEKLTERLNDELEDVKTYKLLAEELDERGHHDYARIMGKIAKDEESHADIISEILVDMKKHKKDYI